MKELDWCWDIVGKVALAGAFLGGVIGSRARAKQFLAENAHVLPCTMKGWYYYHQHKSYAVALAFAKSGCKYGFQFGGAATVFCVSSTVCELLLREESWINYLVGGASTYLILSRIYGLSKSYRNLALVYGSGAVVAMGALSELAKYNGRSLKYDSELNFLRPLQAKEQSKAYSLLPKTLLRNVNLE